MRVGQPAVASVLLALFASPLAADEGRIPIYGPTTIDQPGRYVLVRDIGDPTLFDDVVVAADNVDLDLNGFTITCAQFAISASGVRGLRVHDGFLHCVHSTLHWVNLEQFSLHRVVSETDLGELAVEIDFSSHGTIEENKIQLGADDALWVTGSAITIRDNDLDAELQAYCSGSEVSGNVLTARVTIAGSGNLVRNNVVRNSSGHGIDVDGSSNHVEGNVATTNWGSGINIMGSDNQIRNNTSVSNVGHGISVVGSHNQVEGNLLTSNTGFGLVLMPASSGNVYRGNTARANHGTTCEVDNEDFCDFGTGNTSHDDNYMPFKM